MDHEQQAAFDRSYREKIEREQLEAARAALNKDQLALLESHAAQLREKEIYAPKHETDIAKIIRVDDYNHKQSAEIQGVLVRAESEARARAAKEQLQAQARALKEAEEAREQQRAAREAADEKLREQQDTQAREQKERADQTIARQESARREPVPGSVERFDAALVARKAEANATSIERAGELSANRPNYARFDGLKSEQNAATGEISDAKAERLRQVDGMLDRANERANAHQAGRANGGHGGRGGR